MKLVKIGLAGLAGVALVAGYFVVRPPKSAPPRQVRVAMTPETLARGKFLYNVVADCDGCHGERDLTKFGGPVHRSGAGFVFPPELGLPGKVVAPNITMDAETGLGAWTDGEKLRAIREGIGRDGRALFPMMPYEAFRRMSDADAEALVAYLNTLPAVKANLPRTQLDFPVSFLIKSAPEPVVGTVTAPQDLGEYLVTIGGCIGCHSQEDRGALVAGKEYSGGRVFAIGAHKVLSANITPDVETGIGRWTEAAFVKRFHDYREYETTPLPAATQKNFTLMPWLNFSKYSAEELGAIYRYLRQQKAISNKVIAHPESALPSN